jgi:hypothetical protein
MIIGARGSYRGTDKQGKYWEIPRNVDPAQDGTSLARHRPQLFDVSDALESVPMEEFDRRMEAVVPAQVIARIEHVLEAGTLLASKGLADDPPLELREWRRGMILSWSHARDLDVIHDALGHPRKLSDRHDVDEVVLAKHLKRGLDGMDRWYRDYVRTLDEGAWVNVGFFNPNLSASLYRWGDAREGVQNAMDAHRLSAHHNGSPEAPLDWVERAVNFVVHHIPREHWGIRHEPRGSWDDLEPRLATDPAIKDAEIGKVIARDAAKLYQLLEAEGKVVPWGLLKVPDTVPHSAIEHAFLVVKASNALRKLGADQGRFDDHNEAADPERVGRARKLLARLPDVLAHARQRGREDIATSCQRMLEESDA